MHSGSKAVLEHVRRREADWRWWDGGRAARPMVSLVALTPADQLEAARPERGVLLRVRCAWHNTPHGLLTKPISEFVKLVVDGRETKPVLLEKKRPNGVFDEHAHHLALPDLAAGTHSATAVVRVLETKAEISQTVEFTV